MIDDFLKEVEEAIMALKLAGADVPTYTVLDDGVVKFEYRQKESNLGVFGEEPRS
jgi:hypothetical protein